MSESIALNIDCMEYMATLPDKAFDLAIVDPPYGIGVDGQTEHYDYKNPKHSRKHHAQKSWDKQIPPLEYFEELQRVSKNQIIWGANHFISKIPYDSSCWIVWDKDNTGDFADCELAWTSFDSAVRKFKYRWNGMLQENMKNKEIRMHPTQKPVALYEWLLNRYAKPNDIILDTHVGSASSLIACHNTNHKFVGFELDEYYYKVSKQRLDTEMAQMRLSDFIGDTV